VAYRGPNGPVSPALLAPPGSPAIAEDDAPGRWLGPDSDSGWITPSSQIEEQGGLYVYQTVFDGLQRFKGRYSSDNELRAVFLNGVLLPDFPLNGPADFDTWTDFGYIGDGLLSTGNTLSFIVRNRGLGGSDSSDPSFFTPTGFRAEFVIPEPSTWSILLIALGGLLVFRRRFAREE